MQGEQNVQMIIVGNKADLESERKLELKTALEYANLIHAPHFNVSAKSGVMVEDVFWKLAKMILDVRKGKGARKTRKAKGVSIDRRVSDVKNKGGCCS